MFKKKSVMMLLICLLSLQLGVGCWVVLDVIGQAEAREHLQEASYSGELILNNKKINWMNAEITAYTWTGNRTYTGTWPEKGKTVAVDPEIIPLGSKVYIKGLGVFKAEDTGSAVKGKVVDMYIGHSKEKARHFGRQDRQVVILDAAG
ncbi:MAG: hypothetical protein FH758_03440 [Firmicutes bacterium]|nr:hypothetical protein [Bacillota bacterium]